MTVKEFIKESERKMNNKTNEDYNINRPLCSLLIVLGVLWGILYFDSFIIYWAVMGVISSMIIIKEVVEDHITFKYAMVSILSGLGFGWIGIPLWLIDKYKEYTKK